MILRKHHADREKFRSYVREPRQDLVRLWTWDTKWVVHLSIVKTTLKEYELQKLTWLSLVTTWRTFIGKSHIVICKERKRWLVVQHWILSLLRGLKYDLYPFFSSFTIQQSKGLFHVPWSWLFFNGTFLPNHRKSIMDVDEITKVNSTVKDVNGTS